MLIIEHLDYFCSTRELTFTMLDLIDQLLMTAETGVTIIGTTSHLDKVDKAFRRGGRFDYDIRMDMPSDNDRFALFKEHLSHRPNNIPEEDLLFMARASSGFVSADIAQIVRNSQLRAISEGAEVITLQHLEAQVLS